MSKPSVTPFWQPSASQRFGPGVFRSFYYLVVALFVVMIASHVVGLPWAGILTWAAVLTFLLGAAVFVAVGLTSIRRDRRRRAEQAKGYADFARSQGWDFQADGSRLAERFPDGVRPFRSPTGADMYGFQIRDVLDGSWRGKPAVSFLYSPPTGKLSVGVDNSNYLTAGKQLTEAGAFKGESAQTSTHTTDAWYPVVGVPTPAARPPLTVLPKQAPPWLLKQLGVPIRLQDPAFDDAFLVWGPNISFAFDVLDARTRQWMLGDPRAHAWPLQFQDANLLTWADGYPKPEEIGLKLDWLHEFLDRADPRIWQQG